MVASEVSGVLLIVALDDVGEIGHGMVRILMETLDVVNWMWHGIVQIRDMLDSCTIEQLMII